MKPVAPPMTLTRFSALLDAYGAQIALWPASERAAAELLLAADAPAQQLVATHTPLESWLDEYEVAEISPRLAARVREIPVVAARKQRRFGFRLAWAVALSCVVGLASGALTAPEASADDDEWAELTEVSFYSDIDADSDAVSVEEIP